MKLCKLCLRETVLIKKAHIYSDFLYEQLYDEKHRLRKFDIGGLQKGVTKVSKPPTGVYEKDLLCQDCDNRLIGQNETYVSKLYKNLLDKNEKIECKKVKNEHGINFIEISNIHYKKTKLFLLSILFRTSISKFEEFEVVNLGPYEERLRKIIFEEIETSDLDLQISIMKFPEGSEYGSFIVSPSSMKVDHTRVYTLIINGYLILYFLKANSISKTLEEIRLKQDNTLSVLEIPENQVEEFVLNYVGLK